VKFREDATLKLHRETSHVSTSTPKSLRHGRPRALNYSDVHHFLELIKQRPDWFLDKLQHLLKINRFISVHYTTIYNTLGRAGIPAMKLHRVAQERNEDFRIDYMRKMAQYSPDELVFVDEVHKNDKTPQRFMEKLCVSLNVSGADSIAAGAGSDAE
jgi:hypothetical protein